MATELVNVVSRLFQIEASLPSGLKEEHNVLLKHLAEELHLDVAAIQEKAHTDPQFVAEREKEQEVREILDTWRAEEQEEAAEDGHSALVEEELQRAEADRKAEEERIAEEKKQEVEEELRRVEADRKAEEERKAASAAAEAKAEEERKRAAQRKAEEDRRRKADEERKAASAKPAPSGKGLASRMAAFQEKKAEVRTVAAAQPRRMGDADLSLPEITETYNALCAGDTKNWMLLGYGNSTNKLVMYGSGEGGLPELQDAIRDNEVQYAYLRVQYGDTKRNKFVFITFIPDSLSGLKKARCNMHKPIVERFLKYFHTHIQALSKDDIAESIIMAKLQTAGGANYGGGGDFQSVKSGAKQTFHN